MLLRKFQNSQSSIIFEQNKLTTPRLKIYFRSDWTCPPKFIIKCIFLWLRSTVIQLVFVNSCYLIIIPYIEMSHTVVIIMCSSSIGEQSATWMMRMADASIMSSHVNYRSRFTNNLNVVNRGTKQSPSVQRFNVQSWDFAKTYCFEMNLAARLHRIINYVHKKDYMNTLEAYWEQIEPMSNVTVRGPCVSNTEKELNESTLLKTWLCREQIERACV